MAIEYKTLEVANSAEIATIELWSKFGWRLKSSQRIYNKDTHFESRSDGTYSVTETINFTKLMLERDKDMPHYSELCESERKYVALMSQTPVKNHGQRPSKTTHEHCIFGNRTSLRFVWGERSGTF